MQEPGFELLRSTSQEEVASTAELLSAASVPHKVSSSRAGAEITEIGRGAAPREYFITVPEGSFQQAREVLESAYAGTKIPEGHFLHTATDEDLIEVLSSPSEWSAFDVAHARRLARERGIADTVIEAGREVQLAAPAHGRKAPWTLITYGYVSALLSGVNLIGPLGLFGLVSALLVGLALVNYKERTPDGEFYRYDEASRRAGIRILVLMVIMFCMTQFVLAAYLGSRAMR